MEENFAMAANLTTVALIAVCLIGYYAFNVCWAATSRASRLNAVDHPITDGELRDINVAVRHPQRGSGAVHVDL